MKIYYLLKRKPLQVKVPAVRLRVRLDTLVPVVVRPKVLILLVRPWAL